MSVRTKIDATDEIYININDVLLALMKKALNKDLTDTQRESHKLLIAYLEDIKKRR